MNEPAPGRRRFPRLVSLSDEGWWLFCLGILLLKLVLLALDPSPKVFLGDSASYIWTAISGWIPNDRSFLYGYIVRWLCLGTHSLTPLLLCQAFLGGCTAILTAVICRRIFALPLSLSYLLGLICALDPLQLLWERYVMTEVISLFLYVTMLLLSFLYFKERRLWQIALIQLLGVLVISLRISYLLLVQTQAVLLPILAFWPEIQAVVARLRLGTAAFSGLKPAGLHLLLSVSLMCLLHAGYKDLNGYLSHRKPAYLYVTGLNLLAMWAPALEPQDSPDPRLAKIIANGDSFAIHDPGARGIQLYWKNYLVDRWRNTERNGDVADAVGRRTALHALVHRPLSVLRLGAETFLGYWRVRQIKQQAKYELGNISLPESLRSWLVTSFHYSPPPTKATAKSYSLLQRYFLASRFYYETVTLLPLLCLGLFILRLNRTAFLLLVHSSILLGTSVLFTVTATLRYLQPLSLLLILTAALFCEQVRSRRATLT
jgi:hypothetical protein